MLHEAEFVLQTCNEISDTKPCYSKQVKSQGICEHGLHSTMHTHVRYITYSQGITGNGKNGTISLRLILDKHGQCQRLVPTAQKCRKWHFCDPTFSKFTGLTPRLPNQNIKSHVQNQWSHHSHSHGRSTSRTATATVAATVVVTGTATVAATSMVVSSHDHGCSHSHGRSDSRRHSYSRSHSHGRNHSRSHMYSHTVAATM